MFRTEKEIEQWKEIREKMSKILGREIADYDLITDTILEFIEKVSK